MSRLFLEIGKFGQYHNWLISASFQFNIEFFLPMLLHFFGTFIWPTKPPSNKPRIKKNVHCPLQSICPKLALLKIKYALSKLCIIIKNPRDSNFIMLELKLYSTYTYLRDLLDILQTGFLHFW